MSVKTENSKKGYDLAISLVGGNASAPARIVGVKPQSVACWKKKRKIPPLRAKQLAKILGVDRKLLNPEMFE